MASRAEQQRRELRYSDAETWAKKQDDATGGDFVRYFKLPDGVSQFKPKEAGDRRLHIIPYEVKQDHNPLADVGMIHPERMFYVHGGLGTSGKETYVCRKSYHDERCPICEWIGSFGGTMEKKRFGQVRQKTRQLWNVIDVTTEESRAKGIQVWETNFTLGFGEQLKKKILLVEAYRKFYRPKGGMEILISFEMKSFAEGVKPFAAVSAVEIVPREKDYPESIIDKAHDLDAMLIIHTYDELKQLVEEGRIGGGKPKSESNGHAEEHDREPPPRQRRLEPEPEPDPDPEDKGGYEPQKGDEVTFEYRGKVHEGKVTGVNKKDRLVKIDVDGRTRTMGFGDVSPKKDEPEASGDGWDDADAGGGTDWDAEPAPKKGGKAAKPNPDDDWT